METRAADNMNPNGIISIPYRNPDQGQFPIIGSGKLSDFTYLTREFLQAQKDCGINMVQASLTANSGDGIKCVINGIKATNIDCRHATFSPSHPLYDIPRNEEGKPIGDYLPNFKFTLALAKEVGIRAFVRLDTPLVSSLEEVNPSNEKWVGKYEQYGWAVNEFFEQEDYSSFAGWWLCDEPSLSYFWGLRDLRYYVLKKELQKLGVASVQIPPAANTKIILSDPIISGLPFIVNLLPYLEDENTGDFPSGRLSTFNGVLYDGQNPDASLITGWSPVKNYDSYVSSFISNLQPSVLLYDAYPFESKKPEFENYYLKPDFFRSLTFYKDRRKNRSFPFWVTIMAMKVDSYVEKTVDGVVQSVREESSPNPDLGVLRFSVFSSLAFGAQGIVYWRITSGENAKAGKITQVFTNAAIDSDGNKTQTYENIKKVNESVRKFQAIFLTDDIDPSKVSIDACVSEWPETNGKESSIENEKFYKNVGLYKFVNDGVNAFGLLKKVNQDAKLVIGTIRKQYDTYVKDYLIIVNMDAFEMQHVTLSFSRKVKDETSTSTGGFPVSSGIRKESQAEPNASWDETLSSFRGYIEPGDWKIFSATSAIISQ